MKILVVGPIVAPLGGPVRMLERLIEALRESDDVETVYTISTGRGERTLHPFVNLLAALKTVIGTIRLARQVDAITFHASARGIFHFGPLMYVISRLVGKPLLIRVIGGELDDYYEKSPEWKRRLLRSTVLKADLVVLETQGHIDFFSQLEEGNIEWFCNNTFGFCDERVLKSQGEVCRRLIFLGQVKEPKGLERILEAAPRLVDGVTIDVFGPLHEPYTGENIDARGMGRVRYGGVLTSEEIQDLLFEYDALVLPTHYEGEGYPGVILEAYQHGLPVITTRWRMIPEIVSEETGILIEPHSTDQFVEAVNQLASDPALYQRLQRGAFAVRGRFDADYWMERFVEYCRQVISDRS